MEFQIDSGNPFRAQMWFSMLDGDIDDTDFGFIFPIPHYVWQHMNGNGKLLLTLRFKLKRQEGEQQQEPAAKFLMQRIKSWRANGKQQLRDNIYFSLLRFHSSIYLLFFCTLQLSLFLSLCLSEYSNKSY